MLRPRSIALAALVLPCIWAASASGEPNINNRITDSWAQEGTAAWSGSGFTVNSGWAAQGVVSPERTLVAVPVFEATAPAASITQTDSLSDLASAIDAGGQTLTLEGFLGGTGTNPNGAALTVQFLNGGSEAVGASAEIGPPTGADRLGRTLLVPCALRVAVPVGARSAKVTLAGEPGGIANALHLATQGAAWASPAYELNAPEWVLVLSGGGQGAGCGHAELRGTGPPLPTPQPERIERHLTPTGTISGTLTVRGGPAHRGHQHSSHAVVIMKRSHRVGVAHTNKHGVFSMKVAPGSYSVKGTVGGTCSTTKVAVKADKTSRVKLLCSIR